jgi:hypothetical protein
LNPANHPEARYNHAMAYDAARDRIVLFGGYGAVRYGDTWVFDGTDWTKLSPASSPTPRNGHAMTYDSGREVVVLFGGYPGWTDDTWEWDGTTWTQSTAFGPAGRQYLAISYDESLGATILSCGQMSGFVRAEDTWAYDGTLWKELSVGFPGIRDQHVMAYYPDRAQTVLHGGYAGGATVLEDTWVLSCDPCGNFVCGDAGCDGTFNGGDIDPFFQALGDPAGWQAAHPGCDLLCVADINYDGAVNGADIDAFFAALGAGRCP